MRYLTLFLLCGVMGQNSIVESKESYQLQLPVTSQGSSTSTITIAAPGSITARTIVICEPFLENGAWTPKVKNCVFQNGGTLDEVINTMTEVRDSSERYWRQCAERNFLLAQRGLKLSRKANANARQCAVDLRKAADALHQIGKELTK